MTYFIRIMSSFCFKKCWVSLQIVKKTGDNMHEPLLEMRGIVKTFGNVVANYNVNLKLYAGEIHALLGENGAGKSTLMNILTGIYKPESGLIFYKGNEVVLKSSKTAVDLGIGMVHQHFALVQTLSDLFAL